MQSPAPPPSPAGSEISVGAPSPPPSSRFDRRPKRMRPEREERSPTPTPSQPPSKVKSFSIADILGSTTTPSAKHATPPTRIVRPWTELLAPHPSAAQRHHHHLQQQPFIPPALFHYEQRLALDYHRQLQEHFSAQAQLLRRMNMGMEVIQLESESERSSSAASDSCSPEIGRLSGENSSKTASTHPRSAADSSTAQKGGGSKTHPNGTPLDALFQLSNKNFDDSKDTSHIDLFSNRPQTKKKRKSRTAFSNHQIFELEKRFLYQKYLSPADRDEIASSLGLSNAQVITWFQNRRAKQKRDIEELKKDVGTVAFTSHKSFLENVHDLSILKKKPIGPEK